MTDAIVSRETRSRFSRTANRAVALVALFLTAAVTVVFTLGLIGVLLVTALGIVLTWLQRAGRTPRG